MRCAWKTIGTLVLVLLMLGTPATLAKGRPGSDLTCPTGSAQVVLDPGHGGSDTGAYNATYQLAEKDVTLQIALMTADILNNAGIPTALTRYDDVDLGNSERGEIANACGAAVFVEIHLNGSSDPSVDFTQTFWGKKRKDQNFAAVMNAALGNLVGSDGGPIANNGVGQFANGGLLKATMPSTLAETVFLTNTWEGEQLAAGTRQGEIAQALAAGIENWLWS